MVNPHPHSQYEINNYINLRRYQYTGNGIDGFERGYNYGVNHFGHHRHNLYQNGLNEIYSPN